MRYNEYAIELRIAGMEGSMKFAEKIRILRIQQGKTQQADILLKQYKSRMTPAQKSRFETLFAAKRRTVD